MGVEVVIGFLIAWVVGKARRAGEHLNAASDDVVDTAIDRLRTVVMNKLGGDPAVQQLEDEAAADGAVSDRTRTRVQLALEEATEQDAQFAENLRTALTSVSQGSATASAGTAGLAISGGVHGGGSGITIGGISGIGNAGAVMRPEDPRQPDRD